MTERLPVVGADTGAWGAIINGYLGVSHDATGALKSAAVATALGGSLSAVGDVTISSDTDASGAGDKIVEGFGGVEHGRITTRGALSGVFVPPIAQRPPVQPSPVMISAFQSGHGWTQSGAASSNLNDTTTYILGSQGITVSINASGSCNVKKTGMAAIDLSAATLKIWLMIDDITNVNAINVYAGDTNFTNYFLGTFLDAVGAGLPFASGEWYELQVNLRNATSQTGTPTASSITDIQITVKTTAGGAATFHLGGIAEVPDTTAFPNGVVSVVFDDSYISMHTQGRLKMDQYGYPGTAYTIAGNVGRNASYVTLANLVELQNLHGWEIAGHAYDYLNHDNDFYSDSTIADGDLAQLRSWLVQNGFRGYNHYAYPHGTMSVIPISEAAAKKYFASARTFLGTPRQCLPPSPGNMSRLRVYYVQNTTTTATVQTEIDRAYTAKTWLILGFHRIVTTPSTAIEYSIANFGTIIDYLHTKGIPVRTVGEVLGSL